jgi:hypothetical protein
MCKQLVGCGAFRTKVSLTDRRLRISFDRNQFPILVINQLPAADATIWANRAGNLRIIVLARIVCVFFDIDSRPVPSLRSRICLTSGHFESSANIILIQFFAAEADFSSLKMSWCSGLSEQKQTQLDHHADFSRCDGLDDDRRARCKPLPRLPWHGALQRDSQRSRLPSLASSFFSFHRETAATRSHAAPRFLGV